MPRRGRFISCSVCGAVVRNFGGGLCGDCYHKLPRQVAYNRWRQMLARCTDPSNRYWHRYGGRGVAVCARWLASFDDYYSDVGDCPAPGLSLDRIDNDGGYEPANVRWATKSTQTLNSHHPERDVTHCPQNHEYDSHNTYIDPKGSRRCRECKRIADRARYHKTRENA